MKWIFDWFNKNKGPESPLDKVKIWSEQECIEKILNGDFDAGAAEYVLMAEYGKTYKRQ